MASTTRVDDRVYRAVAAGGSADDVRRAIDRSARGDQGRRVMAVNQAGRDGETPLQAAQRLMRGDLVGLLLEHGAEVLFFTGALTPLALCAAWGQVDSLRALLKAGHDPNEKFEYYPNLRIFQAGISSTAAMLCMAPPRMSTADDPPPPPQLACLEALVLEGGAKINADGENSPLHVIIECDAPDGGDRAGAIDLLLRLGADVNARDSSGRTPACLCAMKGNLADLRRLLEHGASLDFATPGTGITPLLFACCHVGNPPDRRREIVLEIARRSSPETRRAVGSGSNSVYGGGRSAIDVIFEAREREGLEPWHERLIGELLADGAPVLPRHTARVLPVAAAHAARREAEVAARRAELLGWRAQEVLVGLAQDVKELREDEAVVAQKLARVEALKQELRESDDDDSEDDSEEEEAPAAQEGGGE